MFGAVYCNQFTTGFCGNKISVEIDEAETRRRKKFFYSRNWRKIEGQALCAGSLCRKASIT